MPREWSGQSSNLLMTAEATTPEYLKCQLLLFYRLLDEGRDDDALRCLEACLGRSAEAGNVVRAQLFLEAASASALIQNQHEKARVWLEKARPMVRDKQRSFYTVDASIAMSEGRYEDAILLWQAARDCVLKRKLDQAWRVSRWRSGLSSSSSAAHMYSGTWMQDAEHVL